MLVVEDSRTDVFLVRQSVEAHHLDVELEVIPDGEQAIRLLSRIEDGEDEVCPSLVLLDLNLPRVTGLDVLKRIRSGERCSGIPVVIMTSSDAERDRRECAESGATAYFQKPSGYEAFLRLGEVIRELLR